MNVGLLTDCLKEIHIFVKKQYSNIKSLWFFNIDNCQKLCYYKDTITDKILFSFSLLLQAVSSAVC